MELHQLEYFVAVAETGSFSKAAARVGVAQPSMSQSIKRLEEEMGHPLLDRLPRNAVPTEAGHRLLEHARRVLAELADCRKRVGECRDEVAGTLVVGAIPTLAPFLLPEALRRFHRDHPGVQLSVVEDVTSRLEPMLEGGELDVAVTATVARNENVHQERLGTEQMRLLLSARHPLAKRKEPVAWEEVAQERFLVLNEVHCLAGQVMRFCDRHRVRPPVVMRGVQLQTIVELVAAGMGLSVVPALLCQRGLPVEVACVRFADDPPTRDVYAGWSLLRYRTAAGRVFVDLMKEVLREKAAKR